MPTAGDWITIPLIWDEAGQTSGYWSLADSVQGPIGIGQQVDDWSKASMRVKVGVETCIDAHGWHYSARIFIYANRW